MPTRREFLADRQGVRFRNEVDGWPLDFEAVLRFLDEPESRRRMLEASRGGRPALAGVVERIERRPDVESYLLGTDSHETMRFRQAVGIGVRLAMEAEGWKTSGRKGSLGRRVKVAPGTTRPGASHNDPPEPSRWFSKAEIYLPLREDRERVKGPAESSQERLERLRAGLDQIERIGTPEEQAETFQILMEGLARTRQAEGRVFS
ncbi:MAG TPA: hypothetical protein VFT74_16825 [Isosphaeraceae bacterium]|nr:hypothetical protein [Isosphaeraceae bacterium]